MLKENFISQAPDEESPLCRDVSLFFKLNFFSAVEDFINLNAITKASWDVVQSVIRLRKERDTLINELESWIELLNTGKSTVTDFIEECREKEAKYQELLNNGITAALDATRKLETSYRTLESFFRNANSDRIENLTLINANKNDITNYKFENDIEQLIKNAFDRLYLNDSYCLLVIPGFSFQNGQTLFKWASIAYKYKLLLIVDHNDELSFEELSDNTRFYSNPNRVFQNVVMTANWIVGRDSEMLSEFEKESHAFFIPPSAALAGRIYDESVNLGGFLNNQENIALNEVGVRNDLLEPEIASLMDNQVVPIALLDGRVVTCSDSTLYNGDNYAVKMYSIVHFVNWVQKELIQIVNNEALIDRYDRDTTDYIKDQIRNFLMQYYRNKQFFETFTIENSPHNPTAPNFTFEIGLTMAKHWSWNSSGTIEQNCQDSPSCKIRVTYCKRNILKTVAEIIQINYNPQTT